MIERDKIRQKIQFMRDRLRLLESVQSMTYEEFVTKPFVLDGSLRSLQVMIEAMLDIGSHIVAREGYGIPHTYANVILLLADNGVITKDQASIYVDMVRFRNRIVHLYEEVEPEMVYKLITHNIGDFTDFIATMIQRYLS